MGSILNLAWIPGIFLVVVLWNTLYLKLMAAVGRVAPGFGASILPMINLARRKERWLDR